MVVKVVDCLRQVRLIVRVFRRHSFRVQNIFVVSFVRLPCLEDEADVEKKAIGEDDRDGSQFVSDRFFVQEVAECEEGLLVFCVS